MSGGYFDYNQYRIGQIADDIDLLISNNDRTDQNEWGRPYGSNFPKEVIEKFQEAVIVLRKAQIMAQRIDWLVSADDGIESFLKRWDEDLSKINNT